MAIEISDVLANNTFLTKKIIHDSVSNGADDQSLVAATPVNFTCNNAGFEYKSTTESSWDGLTITDGLLNSKIDIKMGFTLTCAANDKSIEFELYIPDPGGDITVNRRTYTVTEKNNSMPDTMSTWVYVGQEALAYGFRIRMTAEYAMTMTNKSLAISKG